MCFLLMSISDRCFSLNIKQLYTVLISLLLTLLSLLFFSTQFRTVSDIKYFPKNHYINPTNFCLYITTCLSSPRIVYPPQTPCPFYSHLVHIISPAQLACLRTILAIYRRFFHTLPLFNRLAGQTLLYATTPPKIPYTYYWHWP